MALEAGTTVMVKCTPNSGYMFVKWRGTDVGEPEYEFEITGSITLVAETEES